MPTNVEAGRAAFERRAWRYAYEKLNAAREDGWLDVSDLERLAVCAFLLAEPSATDAWSAAHYEALRAGETAKAVRCAFWLAYVLLDRGELHQSEGWLARAAKLIDESGRESVEPGYLLITQGLGRLADEPATALEWFSGALKVAERYSDHDLMALAHMGRGQALAAMDNWADATTSLDLAIVAASAKDLSPLAAGMVFCGAIDAAWLALDIRRAREWTIALGRWCAGQPSLVVFRGEALLHRAAVMQLQGDWADAVDEAERACQLLTGRLAAAGALYQLAELYRLRGTWDRAEMTYQALVEAGRVPQPGLALLWMAQGKVEAAVTAIKQTLDDTAGAVPRARLSGAYVEIMLNAGDVHGALAGADELDLVARNVDQAYVRASAAASAGAVLVASREANGALPLLRQAWSIWRGLDVPYEAAKVRVLIAIATGTLGDAEGADMELEAARLGFLTLGAAPDVARVEALRAERSGARHGLTDRELEVIALLAKGRSDSEIAAAMVLGRHTVARHVEAIQAKLEVASRSEIGPYAQENGLVRRPQPRMVSRGAPGDDAASPPRHRRR
jgi:DNA-binding CsgD family transcriptional regulator